MNVTSIKIKVNNLIASGQEDYYIKIIKCYFKLIEEIEREFVNFKNSILEGYIEEYIQLIIYFWQQRIKNLNDINRRCHENS